MTLIQKIKTYFIRNEFVSWKHFDLDTYDLKFGKLDTEILLDIGIYIKRNLENAKQIGNKKHRLDESSSTKYESLDGLLPVIEKILHSDFMETSAESIQYKWEFQYFVSPHERCENTIRICNSLRTTEGANGNCIYPLATIRKFNDHYYCWNHAH